MNAKIKIGGLSIQTANSEVQLTDVSLEMENLSPAEYIEVLKAQKDMLQNLQTESEEDEGIPHGFSVAPPELMQLILEKIKGQQSNDEQNPFGNHPLFGKPGGFNI